MILARGKLFKRTPQKGRKEYKLCAAFKVKRKNNKFEEKDRTGTFCIMDMKNDYLLRSSAELSREERSSENGLIK